MQLGSQRVLPNRWTYTTKILNKICECPAFIKINSKHFSKILVLLWSSPQLSHTTLHSLSMSTKNELFDLNYTNVFIYCSREQRQDTGNKSLDLSLQYFLSLPNQRYLIFICLILQIFSMEGIVLTSFAIRLLMMKSSTTYYARWEL